MLKSKRYCQIPGDTRREMTRAHRDTSGRVWPAGTVYVPRSSGIDNLLPGAPSVERIIVDGELVVFAGQPTATVTVDRFTPDNTAGISAARLALLNRRYAAQAAALDASDALYDQRCRSLADRILRQAGAA